MLRNKVLSTLLPLSIFTVALAAPVHALHPPPSDEPISSSGGSTSGGSTSGGTDVPEPSSMILFGAGAAALMAARRRKARKD